MAGFEDRAYAIDPSLTWAAETKAWELGPHDPPCRPLRIFALDPAASRWEHALATVPVPYEPLEADTIVRGCAFEIDPTDGGAGTSYRPLDFENPILLLKQGRDPSPSDPLFHQQMVYAVASITHASFRRALGRRPSWGFPPSGDPLAHRLRLLPYGALEANAWYDPSGGRVVFGYFEAPPDTQGRTPPNGLVFTSLSHDIIVHEVTHALLDGMRSRFLEPTNPDVAAFHEGFADAMAIFHRFTYREVVSLAVARSRGMVKTSTLLGDIAVQFGQALGQPGALRSPIEVTADGEPTRYDPMLEAHALGSVLVSAVFEAFATIVERKTARYVRLATGGTGSLPAGEIPIELRETIAAEASKIASQFLQICIRAIDYCPPVDITFGEFLRAMLTADVQLVRDDHWNYREALIDAFRRRGIFPPYVRFLTEDALLWHHTETRIPPIEALAFSELSFDGDPARPAGAEELLRQAHALGAMVSRPEYIANLGLARAGHPELRGDHVGLPIIHSIRTARRAGPDGHVVFDLVAEVTQERLVRRGDGTTVPFRGGATVLIGPDGRVRYLIAKSVLSTARLDRQIEYLSSPQGSAYWARKAQRLEPRLDLLRMVHDHMRAD
jgi:hypothetical protein